MKLGCMILTILLLVFTVSCGPTIKQGTMIDAGKRSEIINGQTTAARVVELLGQPAKIERSKSGGDRYVYQYYFEEYTHWYTPPGYDKQTLLVDLQNGVVEDYHYTRETRGLIVAEDK